MVVYSPRGKTRNALALAERFKQAIEAKAAERGLIVPPADSTKEPTMSPDGLVYNVYVVTGEPFFPFALLKRRSLTSNSFRSCAPARG